VTNVVPHELRRYGPLAFALLAAVASGCVPPPSPPRAQSTTTTVARATTSTTIAPGRCTAHANASVSSAPTPEAATPAALTGSELVTAARDAAHTAERRGENDLAVVAVDGNGRPTLVAATPSDAVAVALATSVDLDVVGVEVPNVVHALEASADPLEQQQWALRKFAFSALWPCGRGAGVTVAIVDTGVQADHPDLNGRVGPGIAFLNNGPAQPGAGGTDPNGHGTHVAGIVAAGENGVGIVGVAPEATILPVRVLGSDGNGLSTDIAKGITWAVDRKAAVVNLSLGSDLDSPSIDAAVDYATSHGVVVVAAAGNTGSGGPAQFPGVLPSVIAVAGVRQDLSIAGYSTRGDYVDVAAPGSSILSTVPPSDWIAKSGTSMSSPHVAGLAALIIDARGSVTPAAMLNRLTSTATDAGAKGFDPAYGWGLINPVAALNAA
jgi:subtilisin family serine protease